MSGQGNSSGAVRLVAEIAAVLSIGAGVIHVSAAGDHTNLPVMLAGFVVVATLQVALGALLLTRAPSRPLIAAGLALMVGSIGVWVVSRTAGLPFLEDGHTEPVGFKDGITVLFEAASIPALLLLLSPDLARASVPPRFASQTLAALGVACFALLPPALLLDGGGHHSHEQAVELGIHEDDHGGSDALAHVGPDASHTDGDEGHHAKGKDGKKQGDTHGHGKSAKDGGHGHSDVELAGTPLGSSHAHRGGSDDSPSHHGNENDGADNGGGQDHRGHRDGDKHDGDKHDGDNHRGGGHGDGEHGGGGGSEGDEPFRLTYEPEPSVCVGDVCFP